MNRDDQYHAACLRGERLYGEDFDQDELARWFESEREGYADLWGYSRGDYRYEYHALNRLHGFGFLPDRPFRRMLGMGSAYGDELLPIAARCEEIVILDPSEKFRGAPISHPKLRTMQPNPSGELAFADGEFDLVVAFSVLHHIPNALFVLRELARCVASNGWLLIREPIVSMGDWRHRRTGLTKNERGFPRPLLLATVRETGLDLVSARYCMFPAIQRLQYLGIRRPYNSKVLAALDWWAATITSPNYRYHPLTVLEKIGPKAVALALHKTN